MKMNNISTSGGLTSHLVVVVQPCTKYIPIKKIVSYLTDNASLIERSKIVFISLHKNVKGLITQYVIKENRPKKCISLQYIRRSPTEKKIQELIKNKKKIR